MVDVSVEASLGSLIQPLHGLDLDLEAIEGQARPSARFQRDLERNLTVEPVVPGTEDLSHPTRADPFEHMVSDRPVELGRTERRGGRKRLTARRTDAVHPKLGTF
jgi:hypothetical protein